MTNAHFKRANDIFLRETVMQHVIFRYRLIHNGGIWKLPSLKQFFPSINAKELRMTQVVHPSIRWHLNCFLQSIRSVSDIDMMVSTLVFDGYKGDPVMLPCNMSRSQGSNGDCMDHVQRGRERERSEVRRRKQSSFPMG